MGKEKKVRWNSTFGEISVIEPIFNRPKQQVFRPFLLSSGITSRCCSLPLQRVITDFGADDSFANSAQKIKEHYAITISESTLRQITLTHAEAMNKQQKSDDLSLSTTGCAVQVAQIDGCMIPIMTPDTDPEAIDKRKKKTLHWQEGRLSLAHELGSVTPKFSAVFQGSTADAGQTLLSCAIKAGFGSETQLHGVGDGASWIALQFNTLFGTQGSYLIDFFHVCEYLSDAAASCCQINPKGWTEQQKKHLKNNDYLTVIDNLSPFIEAETVEETKAPVRACHRYLSNRTDQLDYKGAIKNGLPIGSGEIESAHRYVIQKRLKLSGAWWKACHVNPMLSLRVVRANGEWSEYWENLRKVA